MAEHAHITDSNKAEAAPSATRISRGPEAHLTQPDGFTVKPMSFPASNLVAIGAEFVALHAEHGRLCPVADGLDKTAAKAADARIDEIADRQTTLEDLAIDLPAWTPEQLRAKAEMLHCRVCCNADFVDASPVSSDDNLAWSLCQDLIGLHQGAQHPDAGLLAVCAEFLRVDADYQEKADGENAMAEGATWDAYAEQAGATMLRLSRLMRDVPARTPAAQAALVRCLAQHAGSGSYSFDFDDTTASNLLLAVMRSTQVGGAFLGAPLHASLFPAEAFEPVAQPDARLVAACAEYTDALHAYELALPEDVLDDNLDPSPVAHRYNAARERVKAVQPVTLDGILALAQIAQAEATQPDGSENYSDSSTGEWPELVVRGVLRVVGGMS